VPGGGLRNRRSRLLPEQSPSCPGAARKFRFCQVPGSLSFDEHSSLEFTQSEDICSLRKLLVLTKNITISERNPDFLPKSLAIFCMVFEMAPKEAIFELSFFMRWHPKIFPMRKAFFLLFLFAGVLANAQDWQNICSPGTTFYKWKQNIWMETLLKAFRTDTVNSTGNGDTVFISYTTIRDSSIYVVCRDTTGGDALGRKVIKRHDGWFFFFNCKNDTIRINSQAAINDTWRYCSLPGGSYLEAKVTGIISDSVLGLTDQVKVITLQAKNSSGTNISHIFNQKNIKLSQHYGLSEIYDLYMTPVDTLHYILAGKTQPALGIQDFTLRDIYDFDIGDEFHYYGFNNYNGGTTITWKIIRQILDKTIYGTDSVVYLVQYCKLLTYPVTPPNTQSWFDTTYERYNFTGPQELPPMLGMPDQFFRSSIGGMQTAPMYQRTISEYNGKPMQKFFDWGYTFYTDIGCYEFPFEAGGDNIRYAPGLGETGYSTYIIDIGMSQEEQDLVYFKKGSEVWGTPVAAGCSALVSVEPLKKPDSVAVRIAPNPVDRTAEVRVSNSSGKGYRFFLYDIFGRCLLRSEAFSSTYNFSRDEISSGVYFYSVIDKSGISAGSGKIILK
jgi:hypothetical protein